MNDSGQNDSGQVELGMLPQAVAPRRDLWPAIAGAIAAEQQVATPPLHRVRYVPAAIAAAVMCMAIGFWIGRVPVHDLPAVAGAAAETSASLVTVSMGPEYPDLRARLLQQAVPALAQLSPETRDQVEASLLDIRTAVGELEAALGADPTNALLQALLVQSCQEEMRVLTTLESLARPGEEMTL